jgi:hypothetical protein
VFVPGKSPVKVQPKMLDIFSVELHIVYVDRGNNVFLCLVYVTWIKLDSLAFILHFLNQFWIADRSVCRFCEALAGSLSVATTVTSSAKFAVVDSGEVGKSAVHNRYNNGPGTLPWCRTY